MGLQCRVIPLELADRRYYHLDTCFCPLAPDVAIYYPPAFDGYGRKVLNNMIGQLIAVDDAEAARFACNAVVLDRTVITNIGCPRLHQELKRRGFRPVATPVSEFVKAGGGAKCLTLRLDGRALAGSRVRRVLGLSQKGLGIVREIAVRFLRGVSFQLAVHRGIASWKLTPLVSRTVLSRPADTAPS